jgi:TonB-dependent Receptor Plug Domain.
MRPGSFLTATSVAAAMLLTVAPIGARAQSPATVQGHVRSVRTGDPVRGATVLVVGTRNGTITDSAGAYLIGNVEPGSTRISARAFGYAATEQSVDLSSGETRTLDFDLGESITTLDAVHTQAKAAEREAFESQPNIGVTLIPGKVASSVPRLGEADVLRAAQLLPGVEARNDFTAGLNVRGGEADQNLILLDGYPIFNPFHFGGLFGTFIDGAVGDLEIRTGDSRRNTADDCRASST